MPLVRSIMDTRTTISPDSVLPRPQPQPQQHHLTPTSTTTTTAAATPIDLSYTVVTAAAAVTADTHRRTSLTTSSTASCSPSSIARSVTTHEAPGASVRLAHHPSSGPPAVSSPLSDTSTCSPCDPGLSPEAHQQQEEAQKVGEDISGTQQRTQRHTETPAGGGRHTSFSVLDILDPNKFVGRVQVTSSEVTSSVDDANLHPDTSAICGEPQPFSCLPIVTSFFTHLVYSVCRL